MELIKKYYQKIITYGIIVIGLLSALFVFVLKPQRSVTQELYNYNSNPTLTKISFPYSQQIPISVSNLDYIEIVFSDDHINKYQYTISAHKDSDILFKHTYINEHFNAVRIPLSNTGLQPTDVVTIQVSCETLCNNISFVTYNTEDGLLPKIFLVSNHTDYRYLWYTAFLITVGLTLIPLTKETKE